MRPLRLSMTAFGPYAGTEHVDFDALADLGLFTVAGNNGSGKTTIFDGLYFALYGSLPGRRSTYGRMRSDHAAADAECRVELDFIAHGEMWRIERFPKQERAKRRGDGRTESQQRATLSRVDAGQATTVVNRIAEVNAKCRELIGLSGPQFERVALLPQGEFSRLLRESGSERRELLRALFSSEVFGDASNLLTTDAHDAAASHAATTEHFDRRVDSVTDQVHQLTGRPVDPALRSDLPGLIAVVDDHRSGAVKELSTTVDALRADAQVQADAVRTGRHLLEQLTRRAQVQASLTAHETQRAQHDLDVARLDLARAAIPVIDMASVAANQRIAVAQIADRIDQGQQRLAQLLPACGLTTPVPTTSVMAERLRTDLDLRHEQLTAQVAAHEQVRELRAVVGRLGHDLANLQSRERAMQSDRTAAVDRRTQAEAELDELNLVASITDAVDHHERCQRELNDRVSLNALDDERREIRRHHDKLRTERATLEERIQASERAQRRQSQLNEQAQLAVAALTDLENRRTNRLAFDSTTTRLDDIRHRHVVAQRESDQLFDGFIRGSSARLAETLVDGEACTVCGSTEHPEPAPQSDQAVSQAQVHAARTVTDQLAAQRTELEQRLEHLLTADPALGQIDALQLAESIESATSVALAAENAANENHRIAGRIDRLRQQRLELDERGTAAADAAHETDRQRQRLIGSLGDLARESVAALTERTSHAAAALDQARHSHDQRALLTTELHALDTQVETIDLARLELQHQRSGLQAEQATRQQDLRAAAALLAADAAQASIDQLAATQRARSAAAHVATALAEQATTAEALRRADLLLDQKLTPSPFDTAEQARHAFLDSDVIAMLTASTAAWVTTGDQLQGELRSLNALPDIGPDLPALQETAALAAQQFETTHRELIEQTSTVERIKAEIDDLQAELLARGTDELAARRLERVAALVKGDNDHNTSLENWVLGAHLREVVELANVRLARSTQQRFQLCVLDGGETRRGRWGLDLAVEDTVTGTRRPTAGLSGGELFQASLALALGLADVVMNQSAGVRIDALFIDEGFGSLDEASVERVIDLLDDVRSRGATVGVITHVAALLDALPRGITVVAHKDGRGSTINQPRRAA